MQFQLIIIIIFAFAVLILLGWFIKSCVDSQQKLKYYKFQWDTSTVDVLNNFFFSLKKETMLAIKVVSMLSEEQCKNLYNYTEFKVNEQVAKMIFNLVGEGNLPDNDCSQSSFGLLPDGNGFYMVSGLALLELRGQIINYIYNLELVALSCKMEIVNEDVIVKHFFYLCPRRRETILDVFIEFMKDEILYDEMKFFLITVYSKKWRRNFIFRR